MLLSNFYSIQNSQVNNGTIEAGVLFNAAHKIFEGHFPHVPVVPGVCMMQMVKEMVEQAIGQPMLLSKAQHIKFLSVINPVETPAVDVKITYTVTGNNTAMQAEIKTAERSFFKMKGEYNIDI